MNNRAAKMCRTAKLKQQAKNLQDMSQCEKVAGVWGPMGGPTDELPSETAGSAIDGAPHENDAQ